MVLKDLSDLYQPGRHIMDEYRSKSDKENSVEADEAVSFSRSIEDRGKFIHEGNNRNGKPGEQPAPLEVIREGAWFAEQKDEEDK
jgi:hypothetical protein